MTEQKPAPTPAPTPDASAGLQQLLQLLGAAAASQPRTQPRAKRPSSAPEMPDDTATKEDWQEYQDLYADWVARATDEDLVAEMAWLPEDGRQLSPAEAWMYHQCELRRRRPSSLRSAPVAARKMKG